jgi:hypothetical protein
MGTIAIGRVWHYELPVDSVTINQHMTLAALCRMGLAQDPTNATLRSLLWPRRIPHVRNRSSLLRRAQKFPEAA